MEPSTHFSSTVPSHFVFFSLDWPDPAGCGIYSQSNLLLFSPSQSKPVVFYSSTDIFISSFRVPRIRHDSVLIFFLRRLPSDCLKVISRIEFVHCRHVICFVTISPVKTLQWRKACYKYTLQMHDFRFEKSEIDHRVSKRTTCKLFLLILMPWNDVGKKGDGKVSENSDVSERQWKKRRWKDVFCRWERIEIV